MVLITIFGRCEQYATDSMVYLLGKEDERWYICFGIVFTAIRRIKLEDEEAEFLTNTAGRINACKNKEKHIASWMLSTF